MSVFSFSCMYTYLSVCVCVFRMKMSDSNKLQEEYNRLVTGLRQAASQQDLIANPVLPKDILEGKEEEEERKECRWWYIGIKKTNYLIYEGYLSWKAVSMLELIIFFVKECMIRMIFWFEKIGLDFFLFIYLFILYVGKYYRLVFWRIMREINHCFFLFFFFYIEIVVKIVKFKKTHQEFVCFLIFWH